MATKKASFQAEWDEDFEKKIENKFEGWAKSCGKNKSASNAGAGAVYGLGLIGAAVYFIQTASGFWDGVLGVLKAIVWPAFLIYELMKSLSM